MVVQQFFKQRSQEAGTAVNTRLHYLTDVHILIPGTWDYEPHLAKRIKVIVGIRVPDELIKNGRLTLGKD